MNTLETNRFTQAWRALGAQLMGADNSPRAKPKAILAVSAHWMTRGIAITAMPAPRTIHDFGGFPQALFDVRYPAPGSPALAARVQQLLAPLNVTADQHEWGLDHGTWSVLAHLFPKADVPVVQLSLDLQQPLTFHVELGRKLAALRDEGELIVGSGNVVHNLGVMNWQLQDTGFAWAERFNVAIKDAVITRDFKQLADPTRWGQDGRLAVPTPEHYLPLLYVMGAARPQDAITLPVDGLTMGSISMLSVVVG